jgi:CO/xanthine dehydrogenase FAD-binding subunit
MIIEYHRPSDIEQTVDLLENSKIKTVLMGGGTAIDRYMREPFAVIDLQEVGLDEIRDRGSSLEIGASVTLDRLSNQPRIQEQLVKAIHHEAALNLRQVATVAGTIIASDGRSPFTLGMLALDATLITEPGNERLSVGDFLTMRGKKLEGRLVTNFSIPLKVNLVYEYVARTSRDLPIVSAAVAQWPSGRTRVALGGFGDAAVLALDGPESGGEDEAARSAYSHAEDQWASAEYRQEIAAKLVDRCISILSRAVDEPK